MRVRLSRRKRIVLGLASVVVLLLAGAGAAYLAHVFDAASKKQATTPLSQKNPAPSNPQQATVEDAHAGRIRVLAAGDFIAHDAINQQAKQSDGGYDYLPMMQNFTDIFHDADIRFCNDANLTAGAQYTISGYPKFNAPTEFARDMGKVGCNMVNVGTNHSFDRNQAAINASIDAWNQVPNTLAVVGHNKDMAQHDAVNYFTVKGVKFAFLAYTTYLNNDAPAQNNYGVNVYSDDFAAMQIKTAKENGAQVIITSIRWGTEYSPTVNASQRRVAQFLSDQGVSLILGHGSHVLEPVEKLTGSGGITTTVWYSLGNFLNTQLQPEALFNGVGVIDFDAKTKQVTALSFLPLYNYYAWTAAQANASDLLARHDIKMYLLEDTTQAMIDAQQLHTSVDQQKSRLQATLNTYMSVPLITKSEYVK